jgi:monoamine oxidase
MPGVFVAGADYHVGFGNGYIEGAVRSGQQAADLASKRISIA